MRTWHACSRGAGGDPNPWPQDIPQSGPGAAGCPCDWRCGLLPGHARRQGVGERELTSILRALSIRRRAYNASYGFLACSVHRDARPGHGLYWASTPGPPSRAGRIARGVSDRWRLQPPGLQGALPPHAGKRLPQGNDRRSISIGGLERCRGQSLPGAGRAANATRNRPAPLHFLADLARRTVRLIDRAGEGVTRFGGPGLLLPGLRLAHGPAAAIAASGEPCCSHAGRHLSVVLIGDARAPNPHGPAEVQLGFQPHSVLRCTGRAANGRGCVCLAAELG